MKTIHANFSLQLFFVLEGGYGAFEGTCKRKHTKKSDYDELVEFIMDGDKSRKITIVNIIYFEND